MLRQLILKPVADLNQTIYQAAYQGDDATVVRQLALGGRLVEAVSGYRAGGFLAQQSRLQEMAKEVLLLQHEGYEQPVFDQMQALLHGNYPLRFNIDAELAGRNIVFQEIDLTRQSDDIDMHDVPVFPCQLSVMIGMFCSFFQRQNHLDEIADSLFRVGALTNPQIFLRCLGVVSSATERAAIFDKVVSICRQQSLVYFVTQINRDMFLAKADFFYQSCQMGEDVEMAAVYACSPSLYEYLANTYLDSSLQAVMPADINRLIVERCFGGPLPKSTMF